jgi:hypothetical protein
MLPQPIPGLKAYSGKVTADESVFCLFDGVESDVRAASEQAGVPFERVLESVRIGSALPQAE